MALFEVDTIDPYEHDQIHKYAAFVSSIFTGRYLVTVRSVHQEPHCPHRPLPQTGRVEPPGTLVKCRVMPNGVHAHLYAYQDEHYLRFIEVSDAENEALFDAYY